MTNDEQIRDAIQVYAAGSTPPDVLDRALAHASRRRRVRVGAGVAAATLGLVAGTFAGATALARSDHTGSGPSDGPTTSAPPSEAEIATLTGKELADALGLQAVRCSGWQVEVADDLSYCMGDGWSRVEVQELMYQMRGYQRTDTLVGLAETEVEMEDLSRERNDAEYDPGLADQIRETWTRRNDLLDQLMAEQGKHPYTGFESPDATATSPTG